LRPGLVAGRYQPLADDVTIAGDVRPNPSSAVDSEDKAKPAFEGSALRFGFCEKSYEAAGALHRRWKAAHAAFPFSRPLARLGVDFAFLALTAGNRRALPAISG